MNIDERIAEVRNLEKDYLSHKYIKFNENSLESIRTFSKWHSAACVLFADYCQENDKCFNEFVHVDTSGNAYVLSSVYDGIHSVYEILMSKIKKQGKTLCSIEKDSISDSPQIFISHSSKDVEIVKLFIDDILKKGIGLRDEEIACTSFPATGISPGTNIPNYIKMNIKGAKICLAMISKNYKASEVCMNEVGAAWAVDNAPVQIVLPDTDFNELGWLINTDKAAKIDDGHSLDSLMEVICKRCDRPIITPKHWNPSRNDFLKSVEESKRKNDLKTESQTTSKVNVLQRMKDVVSGSNFKIFDTLFRSREINGGEYQTQIDFRIKTVDNVSLRHIWLINDEPFIGGNHEGVNRLELLSFIPYQNVDIDDMSDDEFGHALNKMNESSIRVVDFCIDKGRQVSMSIILSILTIREMDGYMDLPKSGWSLKIEYNISDVITVPIKLTWAKGSHYYYFYNRR